MLMFGQMMAQIVPPSEQLVSSMPSGREYHTAKLYVVPTLDEEAIVQMRTPPDTGDTFAGEEDDSGDEDERSTPVGGFPGTKTEYSAGTSYF